MFLKPLNGRWYPSGDLSVMNQISHLCTLRTCPADMEQGDSAIFHCSQTARRAGVGGEVPSSAGPPQAWHWLLKGLVRLSPGQMLSPDKGEPASSLFRWGILAKASYLLCWPSAAVFTFLRLFPPQLCKGIFKERQMQEFGVGQIGFGPRCCLWWVH